MQDRSIAASAPKQLIGYQGHDAKNHGSDQINLKAARAASLHQRGGMTFRKIADILDSSAHGRSPVEQFLA
jgi:hypothetical protein